MTDRALPDPLRAHPIVLDDGTGYPGTVFLDQVIEHPNIDVGAFSYASDFDPPEDWAARLAPFLFPFSQERLRIGRFCQIAQGVRFITASANHATDGLTTFPFPVFDPDQRAGYHPDTRDTVIGHDVWLGFGALILPGATIGNGVIIGAGSVVRGEIPDYAVVTGNPAQVHRFRFPPKDIDRLNTIAWWNWPANDIRAAVPLLLAGDIGALEQLASERRT